MTLSVAGCASCAGQLGFASPRFAVSESGVLADAIRHWRNFGNRSIFDLMGQPEDPLGLGQLLVRLLHHYRRDVLLVASQLGYGDIRAPHLQVFACITGKPVRLSDLATRAQLSLAATSEFVTELERLGYLERQPDPADGRAKLISLTGRGRRAIRDGRAGAKEIEENWAGMVGSRRFEQACRVLQDLLGGLVDTSPRGRAAGSGNERDGTGQESLVAT